MALYKRCDHKGRQRDDCEHPWWSVLKVNHVRYRVSLEVHFKQQCRGRASKKLALALEDAYRKAIEDGTVRPPKTPPPVVFDDKKATPFREFVNQYKAGYVDMVGLRSWDGDRKHKLARCVDAWGDRHVSCITLQDIRALLSKVKTGELTGQPEPNSATTVRRWYAALHQVFGWAESDGYVERSPIGRKHAIPLQSEDNDRTRRPSADELAAILGVADPFMRDMVEVALETGFRQGTLRQLTGAMIDWTPVEGKHYGIIRVPGRAWKNKKLFVMPMTRHAAKILRRRFDALTLEGKEQPQLYLFGNEVGELLTGKQVWGGWDATLVRAGLKVVGPGKDGPETILVDPDLHFHDLRAEFASQLLEQGKTLDQIRRLLDHSSLLMTQRYLRSRGLIFEDYGDADEAMSARVVRTGTTKRTTALKILHGGKG